MYSEIAEQFMSNSSPFLSFTPFHKACERSAWAAVDEEWATESVKLAESYLGFVYPALSAVDFLDFTRTGNRTRFEDKFFSKRRALCALVLGECVEYKGRFIDDIINGIFSICEESAWFLPAHNTYIRDTPQQPLPDAEDPVVDLFACESAEAVMCAYYLLEGELDAISPAIGIRVNHEIVKRLLQPYLNRHFWWMGNGLEPMNNWTIWCTQNVLISAFVYASAFSRPECADIAMPGAPCGSHPMSSEYAADILGADYLERIFIKACGSIDYFLAEYGTDGCCDEGAQYYRHAGLCLLQATDVLNAVTGNAFSDIFSNEKIRNIASYIQKVHVGGKYYVNFADCSPVAGHCDTREYLFAKATHNDNMRKFAVIDQHNGGIDTMLMSEEYNLYYRLQNAFTVKDIKSEYEGAAGPDYPDVFFKSVGLFLSRDNIYTLAVKAGDNADSHNHNDTGSITVYKNGRPLLIDIGVESYSRKTFSPRRYEIWTMQSAYHNLPTIDGMMQLDGEQYAASSVVTDMNNDFASISMDIAGAYPTEAGLDSYLRSVILHKNAEEQSPAIELHDKIKFNCGDGLCKPVVLSFITYEEPVINHRNATDSSDILINIGSLGQMTLAGIGSVSIERLPITDPRLMTAWEHDVYRILADVSSNSVDITIV